MLQGLGIAAKDVEEALRGPDERLCDVQSGHLVAVNRDKSLIAVYGIGDSQVTVVTVIKRLSKLLGKRKQQGRWI